LIYCPWQGHTQAEGCAFYLRMLHGANFDPPQPTQQTFADVPLDTWYAKWVQAGYDAGLLTPCQTTPEMRFCPSDPLTKSTLEPAILASSAREGNARNAQPVARDI